MKEEPLFSRPKAPDSDPVRLGYQHDETAMKVYWARIALLVVLILSIAGDRKSVV